VFWTTQASISYLAVSYTVGTHKIPFVIISCFVLHNAAKYLKNKLPTNDDEVEDLFQENDNIDEDVEENQRAGLRRRGQQRRREIGRYVCFFFFLVSKCYNFPAFVVK
jgi:hypothetical protein